MYERKRQPPVSRAQFTRRLAWHSGVAVALLLMSLGGGMLGYIAFEHLSPLDAFLNAAMLLGGMGPVDPPETVGGKFFAGSTRCTPAWSSSSRSARFHPVLHRVLHRFHWDEKA